MMILDDTPGAGKLTEADMQEAHTGGWFPANDEQFEAAPGWPLWLCALMVVALVAFAAVAI